MSLTHPSPKTKEGLPPLVEMVLLALNTSLLLVLGMVSNPKSAAILKQLMVPNAADGVKSGHSNIGGAECNSAMEFPGVEECLSLSHYQTCFHRLGKGNIRMNPKVQWLAQPTEP